MFRDTFMPVHKISSFSANSLIDAFSKALCNICLGIVICFHVAAFADLQEAVLVEEAVVQSMDFYEKYTAVGQCKADNSRAYYAKETGTIDSIPIFQGQEVKKGDILITVDAEIAEATKAKAEAAFESAKTTYLRDVSLLDKKVISKEVVEKSKVLLENAKADLIMAQDKYDNMIIKAPFDGYIGVVHAQVGNDIKVGDYLFTIIAAGEKVIFVELPENLDEKVNNDSEVSLLDNNFDRVSGKIAAISNYLNNNGTITAKLVFPPLTKIIHGSFVEADIIFDRHKGLGIPEKAILKNNQGNFVYKITEDKKVKQVYVTTRTRANNFIEIMSDEIKEGDLVVLEGLTKVYEGSSVTFIENKATDDAQQEHKEE
ncbi:MAG: efflux RND transporter periplasmic adaptor subunit [Rickettsiaceae bacterium]